MVTETYDDPMVAARYLHRDSKITARYRSKRAGQAIKEYSGYPTSIYVDHPHRTEYQEGGLGSPDTYNPNTADLIIRFVRPDGVRMAIKDRGLYSLDADYPYLGEVLEVDVEDPLEETNFET